MAVDSAGIDFCTAKAMLGRLQSKRYMRLPVAERYVVLSVKRSEIRRDELELGISVDVLTGLACVVWSLALGLWTNENSDKKRSF